MSYIYALKYRFFIFFYRFKSLISAHRKAELKAQLLAINLRTNVYGLYR